MDCYFGWLHNAFGSASQSILMFCVLPGSDLEGCSPAAPPEWTGCTRGMWGRYVRIPQLVGRESTAQCVCLCTRHKWIWNVFCSSFPTPSCRSSGSLSYFIGTDTSHADSLEVYFNGRLLSGTQWSTSFKSPDSSLQSHPFLFFLWSSFRWKQKRHQIKITAGNFQSMMFCVTVLSFSPWMSTLPGNIAQ